MDKTFTIFNKIPVLDIEKGSNLSVSLDILRGIASLEVILGHIKNLYFVDLNKITINSSLFIKILYFLTGFGHEAVVVFFVLSCLLIGNSVFKALKQDKFSWKSYFIARLSRLWIVLIPALLLGLIWDIVGNSIAQGESIVYLGRLGTNIITEPVASTISPDIFLGNIFFLQNIYFPTLGSNASLWSLSCEFWYYIAFPLMLMIVLNLKVINRCIIYLIIFLILIYGLDLRNDEGFLIWLLGSSISLISGYIKLPKEHHIIYLLSA